MIPEVHRYRKKPVVIEAMRVPSYGEGQEIVMEWCNGNFEYRDSKDGESISVITIDTLEGTMCAFPGDYVIKGVAGEFYPCKPEIFIESYELALDGK